MKTATGLALVAIGAILAFAVTAHPTGLNLQAAGWVLIVVGLAGMFVPRRGYGWLRRRVVVRRGPRRAVVARGLNGSQAPVVIGPGETADFATPVVDDPAVFPGRTLSKAEADRLAAQLAASETVEGYLEE